MLIHGLPQPATCHKPDLRESSQALCSQLSLLGWQGTTQAAAPKGSRECPEPTNQGAKLPFLAGWTERNEWSPAAPPSPASPPLRVCSRKLLSLSFLPLVTSCPEGRTGQRWERRREKAVSSPAPGKATKKRHCPFSKSFAGSMPPPKSASGRTECTLCRDWSSCQDGQPCRQGHGGGAGGRGGGGGPAQMAPCAAGGETLPLGRRRRAAWGLPSSSGCVTCVVTLVGLRVSPGNWRRGEREGGRPLTIPCGTQAGRSMPRALGRLCAAWSWGPWGEQKRHPGWVPAEGAGWRAIYAPHSHSRSRTRGSEHPNSTLRWDSRRSWGPGAMAERIQIESPGVKFSGI